jgi:hypothetical protein
VVQLIILSLALGVADMIRMKRAASAVSPPKADVRRRTAVGLVVNALICATVVLAFIVDHPVLDPGSVAHHRSNGRPPIAGVLGILALVVAFATMAVVSLISRRRRVANERLRLPNLKIPANVR